MKTEKKALHVKLYNRHICQVVNYLILCGPALSLLILKHAIYMQQNKEAFPQ